MILNFNIYGQRLRRDDNNYVVNLSKDYLECQFNFITDDWEDLEKYATFTVKGRSYRFQINNEGKVHVPNDVLIYKYFYVKVHGVETDEDETIITTDELIIILKVVSNKPLLSIPTDDSVEDVLTILKNKINTKVDHFELTDKQLLCYSGETLLQIIPLTFLDNYYDKDEIHSLLNETLIDVDASELAEKGWLIFERYNLE